jgi:hypothetical protein
MLWRDTFSVLLQQPKIKGLASRRFRHALA